MKYKYKILNYWNFQDDLYVNYEVEDLENNDKANVINYYNTSDLDCNYNTASEEEITNSLYRLIERDDGIEFKMPKVSDLSPLLQYVYDWVCQSESDMCHIDYDDWEEIKEDHDFSEEDIKVLYEELEKYHLDDVLTICDGEYKICGYGCLQTKFNDDRAKGSEELER